MKFLEEKDITYEMYKSGLLRTVFYENKILGKKICDFSDKNYLTFYEPEEDYNNSYIEFVLFDSEKELEESFPKKFLNKYNYNSVVLYYSNNLTKEELNKAVEEEYLMDFFDNVDKEYIEDFKDEIYKEYFQRNLNYIEKNLNEILKSYKDEKINKQDFEKELNENLADYHSLIRNIENVYFLNNNSHTNANIEKSKIFLEDLKYFKENFESILK